MGNSQDQQTAASSAGFDVYHKHGSSVRVNSEVLLQTELKSVHPSDTVTWVEAEDCDFVGFAEAGHAKARLHDGERTYTAIRKYQVPLRSLDEPQGSVADNILFACWDYEWSGRWLTCYKFRWVDNGWQVREYYAIVTEKGDLKDGRCSFAEDLIKTCGTWTQKLHDEIYVYEDGNWEKNKALFNAVSKASWDDVIINPAMKSNLIKDIDSFFNARSTYLEYNIPWKRGVIFHGPPGCGKTISIKALMNTVRQTGVSNLYVKSFKASGCQSDQASIREIFTKARAVAPALLIFEDLDSLITDELRCFFLNEVDGVEDNDGLCIIGSTNHLDRIDTTVAEATEGFTFAYLKELFVQTLLMHVGGHADLAVDYETTAAPEGRDKSEKEDEVSTVLSTSLEANTFYQTLRKQMETLAEDLEVENRKDDGDEHHPEDQVERKSEPGKDMIGGDDDQE
ncbi:P-loop containing nucleoside triphosphate hydrolase protein [Aureobasidium pullulans]|uniref:P-loop containing nucleoside triphosphate hydrolase protein n=1 Tax=Aureobasidium pullulans TaxID=5580 RepID=A0A4S9AKZ0_AURPU|nr:P-loop containing nucleoside triphosphate hydrolase protein [Aureobasidium pullulans]